jgi:hypothetical protein
VGSRRVIERPDHLVCPNSKRRMKPAPKAMERPMSANLSNLLKLYSPT